MLKRLWLPVVLLLVGLFVFAALQFAQRNFAKRAAMKELQPFLDCVDRHPPWVEKYLGHGWATTLFPPEVVEARFPPHPSYYGSAQVANDSMMWHLGKLSRVQWVSIKGPNQVTGAGLAHLKHLRDLTDLYISEVNVSDDTLRPIGTLKKLERLKLSGAPITDAGLAHLTDLKDLEILGLLNTHVTRAGVARLEEALPECRIVVSGTYDPIE